MTREEYITEYTGVKQVMIFPREKKREIQKREMTYSPVSVLPSAAWARSSDPFDAREAWGLRHPAAD